jgi:hypothetical protein
VTLRSGLVIGLTVLAILAAVLAPAMPQWLSYHNFADAREMLGVPNFLNVGSNAAFLVVGIIGLCVTLSERAQFQFNIERWPYIVFFLGVLFTAAGSGYYHLAPDNARLFWDRLPMTVAFMGLISSQIVDRISIRAGIALLLPMLLVGAASVLYWRMTENAGVGNVMPYGILQGYAVVVLLAMTVLMPSRYTQGKYLYWVFAWYLVSKLFETFDQRVFLVGHVVSGHTLKHLAAAASGIPVYLMLLRRTPVTAGTVPAAEARELPRRVPD